MKITVSADLLNIGDRLQSQIQQAIDLPLLETAARLQQQTPTGASNDLKSGWDVEPFDGRKAAIVNTADHALYGIVGRAPGRWPRREHVEDWAILKGIPVYLVQRKIGEEGTDRWQEGDNWVGLKRDTTNTDIDSGDLISGGAIASLIDEIETALNNIVI